MRSLTLAALLGSSITAICLSGQSLSEHVATASGATIGAAAGKPVGTAMGKIFGDAANSTSKAASSRTAAPKSAPVAPAEAHPTISASPAVADVDAPPGTEGPSHRSAPAGPSHRPKPHSDLTSNAPAATAPNVPVFALPVVKEPSVQDVASIKVGVTANDLRAALGAPESRVSIPDDNGHLIEICQYWANGEQVGTIRLDNGHVVSVQARN